MMSLLKMIVKKLKIIIDLCKLLKDNYIWQRFI
jgi:hypothetical protein